MGETNLAFQLEQHTRTVRRHAAKHCVRRCDQEAESTSADREDNDCNVEPLGWCDNCMEVGRAKAGPPPGSAVDRLALVMGWQKAGKNVSLYAPTHDRLCFVLSVDDDLYDFNLTELVTAAVRPGRAGDDEAERTKLIAVFGDGSEPIRCGGITMDLIARIILYPGELGERMDYVDVNALIRLALRTTEAVKEPAHG